MKIILIRQADTTMTWAARYDSAAFRRAVEEEQELAAAAISAVRSDVSAYRVYTGTARACRETAEMLFDLSEPPEETPLLNDVLLAPFRDTETPLPLGLWRAVGTAQWAVNSPRQPEGRRETADRALRFIRQLETEDRDCVVICRGLLLSALKTTLRFRGYCLEGGGSGPLARTRAVKQSLHCGGCHHNCLLADAKCAIGQSKARERGVLR